MNRRRYMIFGLLQAIMDSAEIQQEYNDYNLITD